ncbi:hypothetical protein [Inquilinus limosus]|uniref:Uncharacterized protein n=1 Tax=Inquilinus limosus TaxID=171674 RepID=A0A211ZIS2_9PROT|nr:hypothetical protein [Inquilinus limosus]OWJ64967.1 hypothetical protein BWR60_22150 [Inquilinus limosus]
MHAYSVRIVPAGRQAPLWRAVDPDNGADFMSDMIVFAEDPEDARRYLDATLLATGFAPDRPPLRGIGSPWQEPGLVRIEAAPEFDPVARLAGRNHVARHQGFLSNPTTDPLRD